jgi:hypothetical protein
MRKASLTLSLFVLLGACASAGQLPPRGGANLLLEDDIRGNSFSTVYDAVAALRPNWLRTRGPDSFRSPSQIQVYVDNMRFGGVADLRQIPTLSAYYVQWYDGLEASARWGLGHGAGAIYVSTSPTRGQ